MPTPSVPPTDTAMPKKSPRTGSSEVRAAGPPVPGDAMGTTDCITSVPAPGATWRRRRSTSISSNRLGTKLLGEIRREDLQDLLDQKAPVLSFSVVDHLRWHLRAIYAFALSEIGRASCRERV